jgi:hypothetical protein
MTPDIAQPLATSAFLGVPVNNPETFSFSMTIGYRIYGAADGSADGMVFVMHQDERGAKAIGNRGGGIGVYGDSEVTIKPAIAIEWDTCESSDKGSVSFFCRQLITLTFFFEQLKIQRGWMWVRTMFTPSK